MNTILRACTAVLLSSAFLLGCSSSNDGEINPADANAVSGSLAVKLGNRDSVRLPGALPLPAGGAEAPAINDLPPSVQSRAGTAQTLSFTISSESPIAALLTKVRGSQDFFQITFATATALRAKAEVIDDLIVELPSNLGAGQFCLDVVARDVDDRVSSPAPVCFMVAPASSAPPPPSPTITAAPATPPPVTPPPVTPPPATPPPTPPPSQNDPAQVVSRLQGNWTTGCLGFEGEFFSDELTFQGNQMSFTYKEFANSNCLGDPLFVDTGIDEFVIGAPVTTTSGLIANEADFTTIQAPFPEDLGETCFTIVFVDANQLLFGDNFCELPRGDTLDFSFPFMRVN